MLGKRNRNEKRNARKTDRSGQSLCRPLCCSSVAAPLRGCSLLTRGLPKPCNFVSQRNDVPLRGKQCSQPKSLAAPSAAIYEMPSGEKAEFQSPLFLIILDRNP